MRVAELDHVGTAALGCPAGQSPAAVGSPITTSVAERTDSRMPFSKTTDTQPTIRPSRYEPGFPRCTGSSRRGLPKNATRDQKTPAARHAPSDPATCLSYGLKHS